MKTIFVGALAALLLFSTALNRIPNRVSYSAGDSIGSSEGIVRPTNVPVCRYGDPRLQKKDPPLPKYVPNATWYNTDSPPIKYQRDAQVTVYFESPNKINWDANKGQCGVVFAYQTKKEIHIPNPCVYPKTDSYARLLCHELGHFNGWPVYHGDL
jgi:hypothetical protein